MNRESAPPTSTGPATARRVADAATRLGLDAIVLLSPQGFTYATGLRIVSHPLMRWRHAGAVVTPRGVAGVLAIDMEESYVRAGLPEAVVRVWREFVDEPMVELAALLRESLGAGPLRVGIERDFLPVLRFERLAAAAPAIEWVAIDAELELLRAGKTADELATVRALSRAAEGALAAALDRLRVGDTEASLGESIVSALYASGVSEHRFLIAASGSNSQYPNIGPTDKVVEAGDVVRVEVFAGRGGYQAGVARTAVVGEPSAEVARDWAIVSGARRAGLDVLRAGADPREVYRAYVDALGPYRDRAIAFFGHGMGLDMHEPPYLSAGSTDRIEEGAIIGVEPFVMLPGRHGFQVKDVVAVTADGHEMISDLLDGGELHRVAG